MATGINPKNGRFPFIPRFVKKVVKRIFQSDRTELSGYKVRMLWAEAALFDKYLNNAIKYLEFGSGGSTLAALSKSNVAEVVSVECSKGWFDKMREYDLIKGSEKIGRLTFVHADIGDTLNWAIPKVFSRTKWAAVSSAVYDQYPNFIPDTILIDGRFRVACALMVLIKFKNVTISIHDFWSRPYYHVLLEYLDVIEQADDLGVFKPKENISSASILSDYEAYKYNHL
jgi:hypothetical protein